MLQRLCWTKSAALKVCAVIAVTTSIPTIPASAIPSTMPARPAANRMDLRRRKASHPASIDTRHQNANTHQAVKAPMLPNTSVPMTNAAPNIRKPRRSASRQLMPMAQPMNYVLCIGYSDGRAWIGSMLAGRRAGRYPASEAASVNENTATAMLTGSFGITPYSCDRTNRMSPSAAGTAMQIPAAASIRTSLMTIQVTLLPGAPSWFSCAPVAKWTTRSRPIRWSGERFWNRARCEKLAHRCVAFTVKDL